MNRPPSMTDVCPVDGTALVEVFATGLGSGRDLDRVDRVQCTGKPRHVFAVIAIAGTGPPRYRLGPKIDSLSDE